MQEELVRRGEKKKKLRDEQKQTAIRQISFHALRSHSCACLNDNIIEPTILLVARTYKEMRWMKTQTHARTHTFNMDTWPCDRKSLENAQTEKWAHNRTSAWRRWFLAERAYVCERARNSTVILLRPSLQSGRLGVALQTFASSHHYHVKLIFLLQKERCIICDTCGLPLSNRLLLLQVSEPAS